MAVSHSSFPLPFSQKVSELGALFVMKVRRLRAAQDMSWVFNDLAEYDEILRRYGATPLRAARILEVGFGARPYRLMTLTSLGFDARGVDLDVPVLKGTLGEFRQMWQKNGTERLFKSVIRFFFFDLAERRVLARELRKHGCQLVIQKERFLVDDAAALNFPANTFDVVISEGVFEHIPAGALEQLVQKMAHWISPHGLALVRPNIFTGITGGHLAEWFPHTLQRVEITRKSEPWEHLRKKRYRANTYLNELRRADYRSLFNTYFVVAEECDREPALGREYLTDTVRGELKGYTEEDLLSNLVLFVLKPKNNVASEALGAKHSSNSRAEQQKYC